MAAGGTLAPVDDGLAASPYDYERFTSLSGQLTAPAADQPYRVRYRSIQHRLRERVTTRLMAVVLGALDVWFIYWLVFQSHRPSSGPGCGRGAGPRSATTPTSCCWWAWPSGRS
jgi:hypothetical protein